jgi:hypothetical protein
MRAVVRTQRPRQRGWQQLDQQGFRHLRWNQDEHTIAAVTSTVVPRDSRALKCFPQRTIQAITDRYLMPVGATPVPETLNIDHHDGPVNGKPLILHPPSPRRQGRSETV